jgi:hypothetical protein
MHSSSIAAVVLAVTALAGCPFVTSGISVATGGSGTSGTGAGTGGSPCTPMEQVACYDGPPATKDVGPCKGGMAICKPDGSGPGACMGEVLPAPDNCASNLNLHCDAPELMCTGMPGMGGRSWGGTGDDRGIGVAVDSQGNAVVAGFFHGTTDFGDNKPIATVDMGASLPYSDAFVAQYDPKGALRWVVPLGDIYDDQATAVAVGANDDVYVAGYFIYKITFPTMPPSTITGGPGIFVVRLDKDGHTKWGRGYVGNPNVGAHVVKGIAVGPDGTTVAVAGNTTDKLFIDALTITTQSPTDFDGFLFTLDGSGTPGGWVKQITNDNQAYQSFNGVAVDMAGNIFVTGTAAGNNVDFGDGLKMVQPGDHQNLAVANYDSGGHLSWKQLFGANGGDQNGNGVAVNKKGDVFVTGSFQANFPFGMKIITMASAPPFTTAMLVLRLDNAGNTLWGTAFTPLTGTTLPSNAGGMGVAADDYGVVAGGYFSDTLTIPGATGPAAKGGVNGLAVKLAVDMGTVHWAQPFGDMPTEQVNGVALDPRNIDPLGASVVVGADKDDLANKHEAFIARLAP